MVSHALKDPTLELGARNTHTQRQKSLGCGAAYQLLPRNPTSKIHGLSWKLLSHAPQGVRRSSTTSPRVWRGCHRGGLLAIGITRFTVTPLVTGGQHTHTLYTIPHLLSSQALRLIVAATGINSLYEHLQPLLDGLPCGCVVVFGGGSGI